MKPRKWHRVTSRALEEEAKGLRAELVEERAARFRAEEELRRLRDQLRNVRYHAEGMEREAQNLRTQLLVAGG